MSYMQVDTIGRPEQFSNLSPGQYFFFSAGSETQFGMLADDNGFKGIIVFAKSDDNRTPYVITGGLVTVPLYGFVSAVIGAPLAFALNMTRYWR